MEYKKLRIFMENEISRTKYHMSLYSLSADKNSFRIFTYTRVADQHSAIYTLMLFSVSAVIAINTCRCNKESFLIRRTGKYIDTAAFLGIYLLISIFLGKYLFLVR